MSTAQGGSTFFLVPHSPPWVVTLAPSAKKKHHSAGGQITKMDIPSFVFDQFDDRHPFARADPPVPFSGQTTQVTGHGRVDGGTGVNGQGASSIIIGALGYSRKVDTHQCTSDWQGYHGVPQSSAENGYAPVTGKGTVVKWIRTSDWQGYHGVPQSSGRESGGSHAMVPRLASHLHGWKRTSR